MRNANGCVQVSVTLTCSRTANQIKVVPTDGGVLLLSFGSLNPIVVRDCQDNEAVERVCRCLGHESLDPFVTDLLRLVCRGPVLAY